MMGTRPLKLWEPQILSPGRDPEGDELARARANGGSVGYNAFHGHIYCTLLIYMLICLLSYKRTVC